MTKETPMEETKENAICLCFGKDNSHCPIHKLPNKEDDEITYPSLPDKSEFIKVSPSDKTWRDERSFAQKLHDICSTYNQRVYPMHPEFEKIVEGLLSQELTSATIKAKELGYNEGYEKCTEDYKNGKR